MVGKVKDKPGNTDASIYDSEHVANFFIEKAANEDKDIDLLRLVKMCYFGYAWVLSIRDGKKLIDEEIQAWKFGPVIPSVYHAFKHWGKKAIIEYAPTIEIRHEEEKITRLRYRSVAKDTMEGRILSIVWDTYKDLSLAEIVEITHKPNTPWSQTYKPGKKNLVIETNKIKKHYDIIIDKKIAEKERSYEKGEREE